MKNELIFGLNWEPLEKSSLTEKKLIKVAKIVHGN